MTLIKKVVCILLLTTTHLVVGMKKIVKVVRTKKKITDTTDVVFRNKEGRTIPLANLEHYTNQWEKNLIPFIVKNEITNVYMTVKEYFELLKKKNNIAFRNAQSKINKQKRKMKLKKEKSWDTTDGLSVFCGGVWIGSWVAGCFCCLLCGYLEAPPPK